jgi:hypothetical protein
MNYIFLYALVNATITEEHWTEYLKAIKKIFVSGSIFESVVFFINMIH